MYADLRIFLLPLQRPGRERYLRVTKKVSHNEEGFYLRSREALDDFWRKSQEEIIGIRHWPRISMRKME